MEKFKDVSLTFKQYFKAAVSNFWSQDLLILLKISVDSQEFLFIWAISTDIRN